MKLLIFLAMTLSFSVSHASKSSDQINDQAVLTLMKHNPDAYYDLEDDDTAASVNSLLAMAIISKDFGNGKMSLSQVFNECEDVRSAAPKSRIYACRLQVVNSDRELDADGNILFVDSSTESAIIIDYIFIVDENGNETVSDVRYFLAG